MRTQHPQSSQTNTTPQIEQEYQKFLNKLDFLRKEQDQLIEEYRQKLEQHKILRLKDQIYIKK